MAAMSSLKNLPAGYRLNPRDQHLINFYLRGKLDNIPDPDGYCLIPEIDIYQYEPRDLIALYEDMSSVNSNGLECFFFCTLGEDPNRRCKNRKIADGKKGFWHQTGKGRQAQDTDEHRWAKGIFCHRFGTQRNFKQTDWVMHEFRIINEERFVLCRITKKPKKKLSASAGEKRKVGSNETHQETSTEICVLNTIVAKKSKNGASKSPLDNPSLPESSCEASSSSFSTPIDTWLGLLNMANTFTPEVDINLILKQL